MSRREGIVRLVSGAAGLAVALATILPAAVGAEGDVERVAAARAEFGLSSDPTLVSKLLQTGGADGSEAFGLPMTEAELRDIDERAAFVQSLHESTIPYVEQLPGYAGHWIDQRDGGKLVVMLTDVTESATEGVRARMPKQSRGVRFETAKHDMKTLRSAFSDIETIWPRDDVTPIAFSIDEVRNLIVAQVPENQLAKAEATPTRIDGVRIAFEASEPIVDAVSYSQCNGRGDCYGPFKLGVRVFYGTPGASWRCGMGFHVKHSSNSELTEAFLTTGHCGYEREGWWRHSQDYQDAYGAVGLKKASGFDANDQRDIMIVKIADWDQNKSSWIAGESSSSEMLAAAQPDTGDTVYMSLAQSGQVLGGTVKATSVKWQSTTSGEWMWGATVKFNDDEEALEYGDSGSPIYRRNCDATPCQLTPIGIVDAGHEVDRPGYSYDVYFAEVWWAVETKWPDLYVYTGANGVGGPP